MKKVAIMTWWHYANYGTALQVTALSTIIKNLGYNAEVINYIPHGKVVNNETLYSVFQYAYEKSKLLFNLNYVDEKRNKIFNNFLNKYLKFTVKCETASDLFQLNDEYDAFICGSDQIWAPTVFNSKYFLDFVPKYKKISYAPSIGVSEIKDDYIKNKMKNLIGDFEYLSTREEKGKEIIKEICNKEAKVVLDPTLLLDKSEWTELLNIDNEINEDKYILCYFLGDNKKYWNYVKNISKKLNLKIKIIQMHKKDSQYGICIENCDPKKFIKAIKNAAYICTDSFHGVAFAINYNKKFCVFERFNKKDINSQNSRIYNILNIFGLEKRLVNIEKPIELYLEDINYSVINKILLNKRCDSLQFLENSLNEVVNNKINNVKIKSVTNSCCGCGACAAVCPKQAIVIVKNSYGFYESQVDINKCIGCGLCRKVCAFYGVKGELIDINDKLYAVKSNSDDVLKTSSSGGFAYELSKYYLDRGYDIFGCIYNSEIYEAEHIKVTEIEQQKLMLLSGSKYIQSNTANIFDKILKSKKGIFIGTPCQASAVDKFLKLNKKREHFIIIDLICHGVPSYNMFSKYLDYIKTETAVKSIGSVIFRWKKKGWRERYIYITDLARKNFYCKEQHKDLFYKFFLLGHCYMQSCFECNYRKNTSADIRIGDYWGPKYRNDKTGISMIIAHTQVGKEIIEGVKQNNIVKITEQPIEDYFKYQDCNNPIIPVFYDELQKSLSNSDINLSEISLKYCNRYFIWKSRLWEIKDLFKRILRLNG